ncbi:MAG: pseudouridine synthase [Bifidobacterium mongoliense]|nr:pseudouridine synthase [Bifidobacterium mongoliense]
MTGPSVPVGAAERRHRWVGEEPAIPFELQVLYEDDGIIVVDKPHFLATTPRGMWYRQSALMRLRERFGEPDITPAHRLDRATAGIVLFVRKPRMRRRYQMLFQDRLVSKTYECLAPCAPIRRPRCGTVTPLEAPRVFPLMRRSTIVKRRGRLQAFELPGEVNAETLIELGDAAAGALMPWRRYVLRPRTGKTHQLRVHMNALGLPIAGDDLYPVITNPAYDDFSHPLQLVARELSFTDPITHEPRTFRSRVPLSAPMNPVLC